MLLGSDFVDQISVCE